MARTALTVQTAKIPFEAISAGGADFTMAASDGTGGNSYVCTGKELLIAFNDGTAAYTITIDSVADEKNRTGDITSYSMAAGDYAAFTVGMTNDKGWKQTGGVIHVDTNNAGIKLAVLRLP